MQRRYLGCLLVLGLMIGACSDGDGEDRSTETTTTSTRAVDKPELIDCPWETDIKRRFGEKLDKDLGVVPIDEFGLRANCSYTNQRNFDELFVVNIEGHAYPDADAAHAFISQRAEEDLTSATNAPVDEQFIRTVPELPNSFGSAQSDVLDVGVRTDNKVCLVYTLHPIGPPALDEQVLLELAQDTCEQIAAVP